MKNSTFIKLLLLFIFPVLANATEWTSEFPIYITGDVMFIAEIFKYIHAVATNDSVEKLVGLGFTFSIFVAGVKARDGDLALFAKNMTAPVVLISLFFLPTSTVHIYDLRVDNGYVDGSMSPGGGQQTVDNVPFAIAFVSASVTTIVSLVQDINDDSWDGVHVADKITSTGFQGTSNMLLDALAYSNFIDDNTSGSDVGRLEYNIKTYLKYCIIDKALEYPSNRQSIYKSTKLFPDSWDPISFAKDFGDDKVSYYDYNGSLVENQTCDNAYSTLLGNEATVLIDSVKYRIDKQAKGVDFTGTEASKAFRVKVGFSKIDNAGITTNIINPSATLQKAATTTVVNQFFLKQMSNEAVGTDGQSVATEISIQTTLANLRSDGPAKLKWIAEIMPDAINIIFGLMLAGFPFLIIVQSFLGSGAYTAIANYFMGMFAFYFNMASLSIVQSVMSFYTAQGAQESIVSTMGMPFSMDFIDDFVIQQANTTGIAGLIGAASILAITPLIFMGETRGFSAALSGINNTFKGNIDQTATNTAKSSELEAELDEQNLNAMSDEKIAQSWLNHEGFTRPTGMTAVQAQNDIMAGMSQMGSSFANSDYLNRQNPNAMEQNAMDNYISGAQANTAQSIGKQAGFGSSVNMDSAFEVAFGDGEVMGSSINHTDMIRDQFQWDAEAIGAGMAMSSYGKDMNMQYIGNQGGENIRETDAKLDGLNDSLAHANNITSSEDYQKNIDSLNNEASRLSGEIDTQEKALSDFTQNGGDIDSPDGIHLASGLDSLQGQLDATNIQLDVESANQAIAPSNEEKSAQIADIQSQIAQTIESGVASNDTMNAIVASSENSAIQQIASGQGLIDSRAFSDKDGTFKGEGTLLKDANNLEQGYTSQSRLQANKTMGIGNHGDLSASDMQSVQTSSEASLIQEFAQGKAIRDEFGDDLNKDGSYMSKSNSKNKTKESISFDKMTQNEADSQIAQRMGNAVAFNHTGKDMIAQNAQYGATSQAMTTDAKIQTQGGINDAVHTDVVGASLQAKEQQEVLDNKLKQAGADGLKQPLDSLTQAINKLASTSGTKAAGDTARLMKSISVSGGHAGYVAGQRRMGINDGATTDIQNKFADGEGPKKLAEQVSTEVKKDLSIENDPKKRNELVSNANKALVESGMGYMDKDGTAHFTAKGDKFVEAKARLSANNTGIKDQMVLGDYVVDSKLTKDGDGMVTISRGDNSSANTSSSNNKQINVKDGMNSEHGNSQNIDAILRHNNISPDNPETSQRYFKSMETLSKIQQTKDQTEKNKLMTAYTQAISNGDENLINDLDSNIKANGTWDAVSEHLVDNLGYAAGAVSALVVGQEVKSRVTGKGPGYAGKSYNKAKEILSGQDAKSNQQPMNSPSTDNNPKNNSSTSNGVQNKSSHVNPSDEIKLSRENLSNYNKELFETQEKRKNLEKTFFEQDRNGMLSKEQKASSLSAIDNLKSQEVDLKEKVHNASIKVDSDKKTLDRQINGDKYDKKIGTPKGFDAGKSIPINNTNGVVSVDGVDGNGNEKSFKADDGRSRNSYFKNNTGAHSVLPTKQPGWAAKMTNIFDGPGSLKSKTALAVATTAGLATEAVSSYVEAGVNIASGSMALVTPMELGQGSEILSKPINSNNSFVKPMSMQDVSKQLASMKLNQSQPTLNQIVTTPTQAQTNVSNMLASTSQPIANQVQPINQVTAQTVSQPVTQTVAQPINQQVVQSNVSSVPANTPAPGWSNPANSFVASLQNQSMTSSHTALESGTYDAIQRNDTSKIAQRSNETSEGIFEVRDLLEEQVDMLNENKQKEEL